MSPPSARSRSRAEPGEPSRTYDLEAILLSGSEEAADGLLRFTREGGDWELSEVGTR